MNSFSFFNTQITCTRISSGNVNRSCGWSSDTIYFIQSNLDQMKTKPHPDFPLSFIYSEPVLHWKLNSTHLIGINSGQMRQTDQTQTSQFYPFIP